MKPRIAFALLLLASPFDAHAQPRPESLVLPEDIHPATEIREVTDPALHRFYPRLRFFVSQHDTNYHEYMHVQALTVVLEGHAPVTAVEHLFSHRGWEPLLALLRGASTPDRAQAEAVLLALARLIAPLVHPVRNQIGTPQITDDAARVRLSADGAWEVWLELGLCRHRVCTASLVQHEVTPPAR